MSLKSAISALSTKAKILIGAAAAAVVGTVIAAVILLSGGTDTYRVLKVFELNGSAVISREGAGELAAYVGMNLESGDTLTVGDGSTMRISMDNDKYVLLDGGTVLELTAEGTPADSRTSITLKKGTILNELTSSLSANSCYEVSTPKSTMAVRGTSFLVSVIENEDGSYTIIVRTFHGKVEVTLLDEEGRPTGKKAFVPEDNCIIIRTVVNEKTGNPAEIDGISFFAFEAGANLYVEVPAGENPVFGIDYSKISQLIKERLLKSNDNGLLVLSSLVEGKLRGVSEEDKPGEETAPVTTTAETTTTTTPPEADTTTVPETPETTAATVTEPPITTTAATATTTDIKAPITTAGTKAAAAVTKTKTTAPKKTKATTAEETKPAVTTAETTTTTTPPTAAVTTTTTRIPFIPAPPITTTTTAPVETTTTTTAPVETTTTTTTPAIPEPDTFTVSFVSDGVTVYSEEVESGSAVSNIPAVPEKTGYTGVWKYNGAEFTSSIAITENITVQAEYTINTYTVTFTAEGSADVTRTVNYNTTVTNIPAVPEKTGYTGVWKYNGAEFTSAIAITENITVQAEYTINTYTVTFLTEDGTDITRTVNYNTTVTNIPEVPEKTGYTGVWKYNGAEFTSSIAITENITVQAEYTINTYTVTFLTEDGTDITRTVNYNTTVTNIPEVPEKTGYTGKWVYSGGDFTSSTVITGTTNVEAKYTINTYTVTFLTEDGTDITRTVNYNTTVTNIPAVPEKTGYTGVWKYNGAEFTSSIAITENITVQAEYTINTYTVTFTAEGSADVTRTVNYNTTVTNIPDVPEKTGYTGKWVYNGAEFTSSIAITENITVQAEYTINTYTVTFTAEGSADVTRTVNYNTTVTNIPDVPEKTGYTGVWKYNGAKFTSSIAITENITVQAEYTINTYTVTFTAEGSADVTRTVNYNTTVTNIPDVPEKTGYTGVWKYNGAEFTSSIAITENITVQAEYTINTYTVTFTAEGSADVTRTVNYNTTVTNIPEVPEKTGYTGKWVYSGGDFTSSTVITGTTNVEAKYTAITYNVVFTADGEEVDRTTADYDTTVPASAIPAVPEKTGYTGEWYAGSSKFTTDTVIKGDTNVTAKYTAISYEVIFTASGFEKGRVNADYGTTVAESDIPAVPEKTGYTGKWVYSGGDFTSSTVITGTTNVEAKYTAITYNVVFTADGEEVDRTTADYDTTVPASAIPAVPEKTGYTGEWYAGSSKFTTDTVIKGDTNVTAKYTAISYEVIFTASGFEKGRVNADYGTMVAESDIPAVPEKTGYTGKWVYSGGDFTSSTVITGTTNVEAKYTINTYTVTFLTEDGTDITRTVNYNTTVTNIPAVPEKTGYTGVWKYNGAEFTSSIAITENIIVQTEYTINTYTVTFTAEGSADVTRTVNYNTTVINIPEVPEKTGYTGVWKYNGAEFTSSIAITENITVQAEYTINTYTVTFTAEGSADVTCTVNYNTTVTNIPEVPEKTGYTGVWKYNGAAFTSSIAITENITVQAEYTINTYTVTFTAEGSADVTRTVNYNTTVTNIPAVPEKTGYTGVWKYNGAEFTSSIAITENITVQAEYTINTYTVTFTAEGSADVTRTVNYNTTVTNIPDVPEKTGYTGVWKYNGAAFTSSIAITENITVQAEYTINTYTVTFTAEGSADVTRTVNYNTTVTNIPDVPEKTGYTGKWVYNGAEFTSSIAITENITVQAEYTINTYTVTFTAEGSADVTRTVNYNTTVTNIPDVPEKTGYTGVWKYNGAEFTSSIAITENITVQAEYTINTYTVTFTAEGSADVTRTVNYNTTVTNIPEVPEKTGYTGVWKYNGAEFTSSIAITENITVQAEYTINTYTVTFTAEGSADVTRTVNYNTTVTNIPAVPEKTGYTGVWKYNGAKFTSSIAITENITVQAEYTPKQYTVTYILESDGTTELAKQENVNYGTVPDKPNLPIVLDTDEDGSYDYYLFGWQQPTEAIAGDTTIYVTYELYNSVNEVKITDAGGIKQHFLSMAGKEITLPDTAAAMENYEFIGWGAVSSGGYADPAVKEGCTETADSTSDTYRNVDYITIYSPGETITLTDSMRMGGFLNNYYPPLNNFKFAAVYMGRECTLTFKDTNGNIVTTKTARYGDRISYAEFTDEEKEDYNLVWTYNGEELNYNSTVTGDMEIIAAYVPIT